MKHLDFLLIVFLIFAVSFNISSQQVIVTDDASYITPASGAMLDVKSSSKGFMPPRVALTSVTDVITIPSPATGLMVYNTGVGALAVSGIYYWNGTTWVKALVGGADGTNYITITDSGTVILNGAATTFDDLHIEGAHVHNSGVTAPRWDAFLGGLYLNYYEDTKVEHLFFQVQLPHNWKVGTAIEPHVHWAPSSAAGTTRVYWELEYQWVNIGDAYSTTVSNAGFSLVNRTPSSSILQYEHLITPLGTISGTGKTISSILVCRISRVGNHTNDTYAGDAAFLSIDFHYEIDSFGSSNEYSK